MFFGTGRTSSVTHAAGAPGGGVSARPKALVVLVNTKAATPAATASSRRWSVPVTLVSRNSCRAWLARWGVCRVAAWMTASAPRTQRLTNSRSATDPTWTVYGDTTRSRPATWWGVSWRVRTRPSPRCPLLPVTKTFMGLSVPHRRTAVYRATPALLVESLPHAHPLFDLVPEGLVKRDRPEVRRHDLQVDLETAPLGEGRFDPAHEGAADAPAPVVRAGGDGVDPAPVAVVATGQWVREIL